MARFTKSYPTQAALALNANFPSTFGADFIGWDARKHGEKSTESTHARDLGMSMSATDVSIFDKLEPGEMITRDGIVYFREW